MPPNPPEKPAKPEEQPEDEVDEAGEESFPASDPPSWTAAIAHHRFSRRKMMTPCYLSRQ